MQSKIQPVKMRMSPTATLSTIRLASESIRRRLNRGDNAIIWDTAGPAITLTREDRRGDTEWLAVGRPNGSIIILDALGQEADIFRELMDHIETASVCRTEAGWATDCALRSRPP